jgi:hypothetical protein
MQPARWLLPVDKVLLDSAANGFTTPDSYPLDARGTIYYCAFSGLKHMGRGSSICSPPATRTAGRCSGSTARPRRCSTRAGRCPTSSGSADPARGERRHADCG